MHADIDERARRLQMLESLAGGLAHDFNNILSIIEGHAHVAARKLPDGAAARAALDSILKSTRRGAGITRQLLAFGGQGIMLDEVTDLTEALRRQEGLLRPLMHEGVTLTLHVPAHPLYAQASFDHLFQILMNLVINARDATPEGGWIRVWLESRKGSDVPDMLRQMHPDADFLCLTVADNGAGISPFLQERIFDPFFTTKDRLRSRGLGLSVVQGLVRQLQGAIRVTSQEGRGAQFDVFLPQAEAPAFPMPSPETFTLEGKSVLLAEDEDDLRDTIGEILNGFGMKVLPAANGRQALILQEQAPAKIDFLLTDIVMPEIDGLRLGEMFGMLRPETNVVYMSGYPFVGDRKDSLLPAGMTLLTKPVAEDKLATVLRRALELRDLREGRKRESDEADPEA